MNAIKNIKRIASVSTVLTLLCSSLSGCMPQNSSNSEQISAPPVITTDAIVEAITESIQTQSEQSVTPVSISYNWEDYAGNLDALVYGLLMNNLENVYTVFNAALELPDGSMIYGIGYTDYADYYEADDKTGFFPAGFISLIGEPDIPEEAVEEGLEIIDLDYEGSDYAFVYAYEMTDYMEHCVVWGKYLQYGVNDSGEIFYKAEDYVRGNCNESLGSLYSYDDGKYLVYTELGEYTLVNGTSLSEQLDYSALEKEINEILEKQDMNFSKVDTETIVYYAQEAVDSFLLSKQNETFMGFDVSELIDIANEIDPMECIQITPEGIIVADIAGDIPQTPEAATKWLVGVSCVIVAAASLAVEVFVPATAPLTGVVSGAAIEVFCQVVFENYTLKNISWGKVAAASVS